MSRPGQPFIPLLPTKDKRPLSAFFGPAAASNIIRDQLTISTWLCLGALAQGSLFLIAGRIAFLPALLVLFYRVFDAYAIATGWKRNKYMDDLVMKKFSAQIPDDEGNFGTQPSSNDVTVLLIGTRSNHPMGMLAPGFKKLGDYFTQMVKDLEENPEEFGFLGATNWLNATARTTSSEIMSVMYFRSAEQCHAFAHSKYHRDAWEWWNKEVKDMPHLSIFHELYHAPKGHWENIFVNSHASGIASTTYKYFDKQAGEEQWMGPIVDASKGLLKTSGGRMNQSTAKEHDAYGEDPYQK